MTLASDVLEPERAPELQLSLITINDMPHLWEQVRPLLERACEHSAEEMTPEMVLDGMGLRDGVVRLHMLALGNAEEGVTSVMVAAVNWYRQGLKLDLLLTSGENVKEWMPFEPRMVEWARQLGCVAVRVPRARNGWLKILTHWKKLTGACYVLELEI